jgi:hypothetical protein
MEKKEVVKKLVDLDTGELIEIYEGDKLKVTRVQQKDAIKKSFETKETNKDMEEWNNELGGFVFVLFKYANKLIEQHEDISSDDITKLFYLATYVDYDGYLVYNESFMTRNDMRILLKLTRKPFDMFFNKMKKLGIFLANKNTNIKINKDYFAKGEIDKEIKQNYDYTRVYIKSIRYLFENVPQRKQKQLGNYFKLIPYIHRQSNVLSLNPESNFSDIQYMKLKDLKEILGYHRNSVKSFINKLLETRLDNDEAILGFFITKADFWESVVIINPKVCYGGNFSLEGGKNAVIKWFGK